MAGSILWQGWQDVNRTDDESEVDVETIRELLELEDTAEIESTYPP